METIFIFLIILNRPIISFPFGVITFYFIPFQALFYTFICHFPHFFCSFLPSFFTLPFSMCFSLLFSLFMLRSLSTFLFFLFSIYYTLVYCKPFFSFIPFPYTWFSEYRNEKKERMKPSEREKRKIIFLYLDGVICLK